MKKREHVLIVDDQPENISIMIEALQGSYDLMAATDGEIAMERALGDPQPDLILLDVLMPGMSGHDVCRQLKENPITKDIPVIFVTALDKPDDEAKGLELGAVDYITKPISPPVVEARVRAHLQVTQARRVLMHQNDTLETRVREKAADVIRIQEQRVEGLNNFANAVAHQIRNPVVSIGGMAGLLVKKIGEDSPLVEYAKAVRENTLRLEGLVEDISQYVALTVGEVEPISAREVVDEAMVMAKHYAEEQDCVFGGVVEVAYGDVMADRELLRLALFEVFKNAIDFSDKNVSLVVRGGLDVCIDDLTATEQFYSTECRFGLCIKDDGPGIPPENLPFVTDPFYTTKSLGVGLGLTRVKRILCEEMHGSLIVESPETGGTSVLMTFAYCS